MPTPNELLAAEGKTLDDVIAPGLRVRFCGINPGLYSAAVGHHFARPGNRFWPTLYAAGFTDRQLPPAEERELLNLGYGLTNLVQRATASAKTLSAHELVEGARRLELKVQRYRQGHCGNPGDRCLSKCLQAARGRSRSAKGVGG